MAGGVVEGALLLASIAFAWTWGTHRPAPAAFIPLLVVGAVAAAATAGLGRAMWRTNVGPAAVIEAPMAPAPPVTEARAAVALILGIAAVVLVWPFEDISRPGCFPGRGIRSPAHQ